MTLRMRVHDREPIGLALRRFKKLMERSGLTKELRLHQHYEKPCEARRRAKLRKEKRHSQEQAAAEEDKNVVSRFLWNVFCGTAQESPPTKRHPTNKPTELK